jgi:hypothetical protein
MTKQALGKLMILLVCLLLVNSGASQEKRVFEPEVLGVMHISEGNQTLRPLARETTRASWRGKVHAEKVIQVPGPKSTCRIREGQPLQFVMRLPGGSDPTKYALYRLEPDKNRTSREVTLAKANYFSSNNRSPVIQGTSTEPGILQLDVSKYGESSYKFIPIDKLGPGEYLFASWGTPFDFTFGIDAGEGGPTKPERQ